MLMPMQAAILIDGTELSFLADIFSALKADTICY
jgi:hypothetical protein